MMFYLWRSVRYYRWRTLVLILGCSLSAALLSGALLTADSMSGSLETIVRNRLGHAEKVLSAPQPLTGETLRKAGIVPVLTFDAYLRYPRTGVSRKIHLYGVDSDFGNFSPSGKPLNPTPAGEGRFGETLMSELGIKRGDRLHLRFSPQAIASELPLSNPEDAVQSLSFKAAEALSAGDFGRFNPEGSQQTPLNLFVDRCWLAEQSRMPGAANLGLCDTVPEYLDGRPEDFKLERLTLNDGRILIRSKRFFLPRQLKNLPGERLFAYIGRAVETAKGTTAYPLLLGTESLCGSEMTLSRPAAERLGCSAGDTVRLTFPLPDGSGRFTDSFALFTLKGVFEPNAADSVLFPELPGVTAQTDCLRWSTALDLDLNAVSAADREDWKRYGAAPKVHIAYDRARTLFANRYGEATGIITDSMVNFAGTCRNLPLSELLTVKSSGTEAVENALSGVDFKSLFVGLTLSVMLGALYLWLALLRFTLDSRREEFKLLRAAGWQSSDVRRMVLGESLLTALGGLVLGLPGGLLLTLFFLHLLRGVWNGIAGTPDIVLDVKGSSFAVAGISALLFTFLSTLYALRRHSAPVCPTRSSFAKPARFAVILIPVLTIGAWFSGVTSVLFFYLSGTLFLLSGLGAFRFGNEGMLTLRTFAFLRSGRDGNASFPIAFLTGLSLYLVLAVGGWRFDAGETISDRSGSGGFAWRIETALPVSKPPEDTLAIRVSEGANADCLNLNRVRQPRIFGVPDTLFEKHFTVFDSKPFFPTGDTAVLPAVADAAVLEWSLKIPLNGELPVPTPSGNWHLRFTSSLEPSVFQGGVCLRESDFLKLYPEHNGYRLFLSDTVSPELSRFLPDAETSKAFLERFNALQNNYLNIFLQLGLFGVLLGVSGTFVTLIRLRQSRRTEHELLLSLGYPPVLIRQLFRREIFIPVCWGVLIAILSAALALLPRFGTV